MARQGTRFYQDPNEEDELLKLRSLVEGGGLGAPSAPDPLGSMQLDPEPIRTGDMPAPDMSALDSMQLDPEPVRTGSPAPYDPMPTDMERAADRRAIDGGSSPSGGGWEDLMPDLGTIVALALDGGMNKGRGAGQIVSAYTANSTAARQQKNANKQRLAEIKARKEADPFAQMLALEKLEGGRGNLEARQKELDERKRRQDEIEAEHRRRDNPESDRRTTEITQEGRKQAARVTAREQTEADMAPITAQTEATIRGAKDTAGTNAVTNALRANPRALTIDQAADNQRADEGVELKATAARIAAENASIKQRQGYQKDVGKMVEVASLARKLRDIFDKNPNDLPGVGMYDRNKPKMLQTQDDKDVIREMAMLRSFIGPDLVGLATSKPEEERMSRFTGDEDGFMSDEGSARAAIKDIVTMAERQLRSKAVGREDAARGYLTESGLGDLLGPAARAAEAGAPTGGAMERRKLKRSIGKEPSAPAQTGELGVAPVSGSLFGDEDDEEARNRGIRIFP